jgi:hypothetical protein
MANLSRLFPLIFQYFSYVANKGEISGTGIRNAVFASAAIAALTSGCATVPVSTATVPSASTKSGYPVGSIDKRSTTDDRRSKKTMHARFVSDGYLGRAPYICSPSGFGRTSSCFLRRK